MRFVVHKKPLLLSHIRLFEMNKSFLGLVLLMFFGSPIHGQLKIHINPKIYPPKASTTTKGPDGPKRIETKKGYRIQIAFGTNRQQMEAYKLDFIRNYPRVTPYLSFQSPNFNLRVGDFATKADAEKFRSQIVGRYPLSNLVIETVKIVTRD
ncbi:MAG: hypothetical protein RIQ90_862 [Bacteroidota bacterium]|jgi:hypothetical protein